jgi:galactose mutarotase-like enzyme
MQTSGFELPYVFKRTAHLDKSSLVFDYTVINNSGQPLPYIYTFHPVFKATTGSKLELPSDMNVKVSFSMKNWMGKSGETRKLGEIRNEDGSLFIEKMFKKDSGGYWKFFTEKMNKGELIFSNGDSPKIVLSWPTDMFPYLAVWCSEGNVGGQNHFAIEPSTSSEESLEKAYTTGEARIIPPKGKHEWQIRISIIK